ncbi:MULTISPECIES: hypothetical protein [Nocardioides]|uniref:Integral membrane protein n=1 Tax=Nocardioides vastitatis TaxID=2568655 RepID=A0ABW0ZM33_9ACTN|nr:hypothetical protein [Nocardioides sp.]THJ07742.1 hypothetical protein E7Z54_05285 [Nocardioides sp.]
MRNTSAFVLVLLATLVAPLPIGTSWLSARVDDREKYVETVSPLADDPDVRRLLSDAAARAATDALQQHIPVGLPPQLAEWAREAADMVVEGPGFQEFWDQANADVHAEVKGLVDDPEARAEGYVTVDASPLLGQVLLSLEERGIPVGLLPDVPLNIPVVPESELIEVSDQYRAADTASRWLPVVWGGLVVLAVLVAAGWRGRVRTLGFALLGVALAAGVVLMAVDPLAEFAADQAGVGQEELVGMMLDVVLTSLSSYAKGFLVSAPIGLILVAVTMWPRRRRDSFKPHTEDPLAA